MKTTPSEAPPGPTLAQMIPKLAKATGRTRVNTTADPLQQQMLTLRLLAEAIGGGMTWADAGTILLGYKDARAAKHFAKRLAHITQKELARRQRG